MNLEIITKIKIKDDIFYLALEVAKIWGHTNLTQFVNRNLEKTEYLYVSNTTHKETFLYLIKNKIVSNKTRKVMLITDSGLLTLAIKSNTPSSIKFINKITKTIIQKREELGVSEEDFINMFQDSYTKSHNEVATYVMYDEISGYYKIGISKNPKARESTISSQLPKIKTILYLDRNIEKTLHALFSSKKIRGEWFNLNADDIITITCDFGFKKFCE
jgi:prophage antirepressor-like protein